VYTLLESKSSIFLLKFFRNHNIGNSQCYDHSLRRFSPHFLQYSIQIIVHVIKNNVSSFVFLTNSNRQFFNQNFYLFHLFDSRFLSKTEPHLHKNSFSENIDENDNIGPRPSDLRIRQLPDQPFRSPDHPFLPDHPFRSPDLIPDSLRDRSAPHCRSSALADPSPSCRSRWIRTGTPIPTASLTASSTRRAPPCPTDPLYKLSRFPLIVSFFFFKKEVKRLPGVGTKTGSSEFHLFSHFSPLYR
jgi:hypothetical protein